MRLSAEAGLMAGQAIGELLRRRRVDAAIRDWNDRLEREHGLDSDEVEALEPYVRYLCHYGRGLDLAVAAVVSGAWIVTMSAAVLYRVLVFDPTESAVALYGGAATVGFDVLTLALPMLGLVGALYWMRRRYRRYTVAAEIRSHLVTDPSPLLHPGNPLPVSEETVRTAPSTTTWE
jgi:hypothetical protein